MSRQEFLISGECVSKIQTEFGDDLESWIKQGSHFLWRENPQLYQFLSGVERNQPNQDIYRFGMALGYLIVTCQHRTQGKVPVITETDLEMYKAIITNNITDPRWKETGFSKWMEDQLARGQRPGIDFVWFNNILRETSPEFLELMGQLSVGLKTRAKKSSLLRGIYDTTIPFYLHLQSQSSAS